MASNQDIALFQNDLLIRDGDFVIAESDEQHVMDTINAFPGWWKENPPDGVGIFSYLNSTQQIQHLQRSIKINLMADGYSVDQPVAVINNGTLVINPNAVNPNVIRG